MRTIAHLARTVRDDIALEPDTFGRALAALMYALVGVLLVLLAILVLLGLAAAGGMFVSTFLTSWDPS